MFALKTSDTKNPSGKDERLRCEGSIDNVDATRAKHEESKRSRVGARRRPGLLKSSEVIEFDSERYNPSGA